MTNKTVRLQILGDAGQALTAMTTVSDKLRELSDKGANISLKLDSSSTMADIDKLSVKIKELSDKGSNIRVSLTGAGTAEVDLDKLSLETAKLSDAGAKVSTSIGDASEKTKSWGASALSSLGSLAMMTVGFSSIAGGIGEVISQGSKYQQAQAQLNNAISDAHEKTSTYSGDIGALTDKMAKFGYTGSQVDDGLTKLVRATGDTSLAISVESTAANLAAARHISLSDACGMLAKAAGGAMKGMKDLGITQVTGATQAKAMATAQTTLQDQISSAGGIAEFAAAHNMSLAQATKLVAEAQGQAAAASDELAGKGLTLASVTTKVQEAQNGDASAIKELAKAGLTVSQAQDLITESSSGNINAFNQLGIVVLPKTATAAQRLAEIQTVLNDKLGGAAAAQADTYAGHIAALKAEFENISETVGMHVLPALTTLLGLFASFIGNKTAMLSFGIAVALVGGYFLVSTTSAEAFFTVVRTGLVSTGIGLLIMAIAVALYELLTHWQTVTSWLHDVFFTVWDALDDAFQSTINWLKANWPLIVGILTGPLGLAAEQIATHLSDIKNFFSVAWEAITSGVKTAWNAIANFFTSWWNSLLAAWKSDITTVEGAFSGAWNSVFDTIKSIWGSIKSFFTSWWNDEVSGWNTVITEVENIFSNAWNNIESTAKTVFGAISKFFSSFWADTKAGFNQVVSDVQSIWGRIESAVATPVRWIASSIWNPFADVVDAVTSFLSLGKPIPYLSLAAGGKIPGYGGGEILPALLEPGETIVSKEKSRDLAPIFAAAGVPGYQFGGVIGAITSVAGDIASGVTSAASDVWGAVKDVASFAKSLVLGGITALATPILNSILSLAKNMPGANTGFGQMILAWPPKLVSAFLDWLKSKDVAPVAAAGTTSGGVGNIPANAAAIASFLEGQGFTKIAAAGILGNIEQESGGNPMAGTNPPGRGLIQILGDPGGTLSQELARTMTYIRANGSVADINAHSQTPTSAATWFCNVYERPGTPMLANRIASANASYAAGYAHGGLITEPILGIGLRSGGSYSFGELGNEVVTPVSGPAVAHGGSGDIHITVNAGDCIDPNAVAQAIHLTLRRYKKKKGNQPLGLD